MSKFGRRAYQVRDTSDAKVGDLRVRVIVEINGKREIDVQGRNPGLIAILTKPDSPKLIEVEMVEDGGKKHTDIRQPPGAGDPLPWQRAALGLDE